jgi:hypothetical protein
VYALVPNQCHELHCTSGFIPNVATIVELDKCIKTRAEKFSLTDVMSNRQKLNPEFIRLLKKYCASLQHPSLADEYFQRQQNFDWKMEYINAIKVFTFLILKLKYRLLIGCYFKIIVLFHSSIVEVCCYCNDLLIRSSYFIFK